MRLGRRVVRGDAVTGTAAASQAVFDALGAAGIDVDARGNVFVCDLVNQEVVEVSPEGRKLSARSDDPTLSALRTATQFEYRLSCVSMTPFGLPVVPDV